MNNEYTIMNKRWNDIKHHFKNGGKVIWNDPEPIIGNNYQVSFLEDIPDEEIDNHTPILIQYNDSGSEAQVFLHELIILK